MSPSEEATQYEEFAATAKGSPATKLEKYIEARCARTGRPGRPVDRAKVVERLKAAGYPV